MSKRLALVGAASCILLLLGSFSLEGVHFRTHRLHPAVNEASSHARIAPFTSRMLNLSPRPAAHRMEELPELLFRSHVYVDWAAKDWCVDADARALLGLLYTIERTEVPP